MARFCVLQYSNEKSYHQVNNSNVLAWAIGMLILQKRYDHGRSGHSTPNSIRSGHRFPSIIVPRAHAGAGFVVTGFAERRRYQAIADGCIADGILHLTPEDLIAAWA
jgi:hypothetical protein